MIEWQPVRVKLGDLKPWGHNPRQSTKTQAQRILASFGEFGQVQAVAIGPECEVYDGHQRLSALLTLHGKSYEIDARRASRALTDDERKRLVLMLHAGATGEWDWDILSSFDPVLLQDGGLDKDLLAQMNRDSAALMALLEEGESGEAASDVEPQVDRAEELREKWGVRSGQLWQLDSHRLLCGDSTKAEDVARVMGGEKADCVFTSPPYAVGVDYGETYQDTIESLRGMLPKLSRIWQDIVVDGGFAVLNFGDIAGGRDVANSSEPCEYPMALEYWPVFRADGWLLWSRRVWCKPNARVNSMWCIQSNRAATDWEHLWTWRKAGQPIIKRVDGEMRSPRGWMDSSSLSGVDVGKDDHGAGMATGISVWMVNVHSRDAGIVHEPFCGTGTTLIACEQLGRKCRAIEISPAYIAVALERWSTATGKTPTLIEP